MAPPLDRIPPRTFELPDHTRNARIPPPHDVARASLSQMEKFLWMQALEIYEQSHEGMSPSFQQLMANRFSALLQSRSTPEKDYTSEDF